MSKIPLSAQSLFKDSTLDTDLFLKLHDNWLRIWKTLEGLHVIILRNFVIWFPVADALFWLDLTAKKSNCV